VTATGKLVRDLIPQIIEADGGTPATRQLTPAEHLEALHAKLLEELEELRAATTPDEQRWELADLAEVLHGLAHQLGQTWDDVEAARVAKRAERGGFEGGIWLDANERR
jgi:predicted house-cleaning noncanonical NTP pyrophosphatase (MazG superfamily)